MQVISKLLNHIRTRRQGELLLQTKKKEFPMENKIKLVLPQHIHIGMTSQGSKRETAKRRCGDEVEIL